MQRRSHLALIVLLLAWCGRLSAGEILDRVVAVVNGHPILASEWDAALRYECFQNQHAISDLKGEERQAALQRLIDQHLIEDEMEVEGSSAATAEEVGHKLAQLRDQMLRDRKQLSNQENASWEAVLAQFGFTQTQIEEHVTRELTILRFVERRFRPTIQIDPSEIERYYRETLMPELRKEGAADPPLAAVERQIRELLVQKALDEQLNRWLQALRLEHRIQIR